LAALSSVTEKIRLGTSVLIAALRNPVLLADITATIQETSGGRLMLGVGGRLGSKRIRKLGSTIQPKRYLN
jgi:alkanesulfonate monooxygenase SsuD/methylene tetrahydromethanopterin reductase-like flavin-dependent oxidoreductase (luciferase family)